MKYLVNKETKEHIVFHADLSVLYPQWGIVEADSEGWIPWNGEECPLPASNQAEVKLQDGKQGRFDSIPFMTHRSWQKWNCGGDIVAYRPILETAEKAAVKESFATESVFDRLKSAIAASESIPAIIAEIDAMLPEGYCVTRCDVAPAGEPAKQPVEDMSDWRNWQVGDVLEAVEDFAFHLVKDQQYVLQEKSGACIYVDSCVQKHAALLPERFRFHSRPAKVAE